MAQHLEPGVGPERASPSEAFEVASARHHAAAADAIMPKN